MRITFESDRLIRASGPEVWAVFMEQVGLSGLDPGLAGTGFLTFAPLGFNLRVKARIKSLVPGESLVLEGRCLGINTTQSFSLIAKKKGTLMVFQEELSGWPLALTAVFTDLKGQGRLNQAWLARLAGLAEKPTPSP
ncbi:hypothetical protein [Dethiosulfatarculus sandiegensis]|uniref:Uncharacterized protein n=1 Tax=Dethiosulfatarculus sandiegensis TaxID=1429043 RepID=A0A0D2HZI2_9BACT|nr:hypothetical protein [Dethiosulfatarculus sandiegensis]KIX15683.1 hypothetical protein X474_02195 [Dethiosulfatarculus sandiegensis]